MQGSIDPQLRASGSRYGGAISKVVALGLGLLAVIYSAQLFSPLRVNTDALSILRLTARLTDGQSYTVEGARPVYPIGVPFVFSVMERIGVARPWGFGLLNLACLFAAAGATVCICRSLGKSRRFANGVVLFSFASYVLLKHSMIPLTDIPHMATALVCACCLEKVLRRERGWQVYLAISVGAFAGALLTRRTGIALAPALVWAIRPREAAREFWSAFRAKSLAVQSVAGVALLVAAAAVVIVLRLVIYIPEVAASSGTLMYEEMQVVRMHFQELGELAINMPANGGRVMKAAGQCVGLIVTCLILRGFYGSRGSMPVTYVYLAVYTAMMFAWPFSDTRFWIPVLPLLAIVAGDGLAVAGTPRNWRRCALVAYFCLYGCVGLAAAAYTTRLTFSGSAFPRLYGGGSFRAAYEAAWYGGPDTDPDTSLILMRYGTPQAAGFSAR